MSNLSVADFLTYMAGIVDLDIYEAGVTDYLTALLDDIDDMWYVDSNGVTYTASNKFHVASLKELAKVVLQERANQLNAAHAEGSLSIGGASITPGKPDRTRYNYWMNQIRIGLV